MEKNKKEDLKKDKEESSRPHFTKVIEYNHQLWLTDIIFGQRNSNSHAHATLSGAQLWYLRDEMGNEIIRNGNLVSNNTSQQ